MPQGYKCDRCKAFVEQERQEIAQTDYGPLQDVRLYDELGDEKDKLYTLCPECREALVEWIDGKNSNMRSRVHITGNINEEVMLKRINEEAEIWFDYSDVNVWFDKDGDVVIEIDKRDDEK